MPGPSDIRVNPFNNATNYVNLTERHIVPSVSPFVVRLNEVPEKQDPSNMQMFYVDDTTGQTTETALTEVAATPGAGEFRPDYSTNAFDDTSWNTGLIEFSSADAGKIIEVSYTATGTLAGVKTNRYPAWWTDRGDGSDGDFAPESNVTISGLKQYKSVFIKAGVTVTVGRYARIKTQGAFVVNGTLTANGQGYPKGTNGMSGGNGGASGRGYGAGGNGGYIFNYAETAERTRGYVSTVLQGYGPGAGGGSQSGDGQGGNGGGAMGITCMEFRNNGTVSAEGNQGGHGGDYGGGGGAGGTIIVIANRIVNEGTITVNGGAGGTAEGGTQYPGSAGAAGYKEIVEIGG